MQGLRIQSAPQRFLPEIKTVNEVNELTCFSVMARRPLGHPFLPPISIASTAIIGVAAFAFLIAAGPHRPPTPAEPPSTPPAEPPAAAEEILLAGSHAEWTAEWAGVYRRTKMHNGAPYYSKSGDDSRVVWRQKAAHGGGFLWHVGHPADVAQGEAVIAADDGGAASPDLVSSGWRAVEGPAQLTPLLAETQAPPRPECDAAPSHRSRHLAAFLPPPVCRPSAGLRLPLGVHTPADGSAAANSVLFTRRDCDDQARARRGSVAGWMAWRVRLAPRSARQRLADL